MRLPGSMAVHWGAQVVLQTLVAVLAVAVVVSSLTRKTKTHVRGRGWVEALRSGAGVCDVLMCDGVDFCGEMFKSIIRNALFPRPVLFYKSHADPDLILASVFGKEHARFPGVPKVLIVGEPTLDPKLAREFELVVVDFHHPKFAYVPFWAMPGQL